MKIQITQGGQPAEATVILAAAFLGLFAIVLIGAFVTRDRDLMHSLSQGLLNILIAVAAFYFGSSQGSQKKDDTIATALNTSQTGDPK